MACCAALALLLGLVRGTWFRVFPGRRPAEPGFAPPARRSADGTTPAAPATTGRRRTARPAIAGSLLLGTAYGAAAYALAIAVLRATPVVRTLDGPWAARDVALVVLAVAALVAGLSRRGPASRPALLLGAGAAWTELGLVDMHLLGLFELRVAALPLDLLLHGSGPLLLVLAARRLTLSRPTTEASPT
ncbi:MAG TPA: hypothetical protein VM575_06230 [Nocardioides sp.]|nr:hypothetical protein [Nocardioides sp.]